jgi:iron complex outermembrane receptor protein
MAGYEWQDFHKKNTYHSYGIYPATNTENPGGLYNENANPAYKTANYLVSFFGRLNYTLAERYLLTATVRADGSSRFNYLKPAKNQQWGIFPSAAFAWKINEEAFLKNVSWLSDLKLRLGWGITGQQEGIGDYNYIPTYTPNIQGAYYDIFGDGSTTRPDGFYQGLTWEKTTTWNAGLDFGFWNDRLTINVDAYYRKTTDLINSVVLPVGTNFTNKINKNIGSLHNTGVEAAINWRAIQSSDLTWILGYNVTWNKNEIDELVDGDDTNYMILYGGAAYGVGGNIRAHHVGSPVGVFYPYQQVYDTNGQPIRGLYVDRNGDGVITAADRYLYKKAAPDVTMGFTSKVLYKNWDFSFSTRASLNNYVYNGVEAGGVSNVGITGLYGGNAWRNVYKDAAVKQWTGTDETSCLSDYFIQNASFFKLDNVTLGYSFQRLFNTGINGRVFLTAQNVLTITDYKGIDPEIDGGYDGSIYPRPFMGIFGLSLNF